MKAVGSNQRCRKPAFRSRLTGGCWLSALSLESLEDRRLLNGQSLFKDVVDVDDVGKAPTQVSSSENHAVTRIVGGVESTPGKWPWMASLQHASHFCGGSLVAPDAILTAAHCVEGEDADDLRVVLGRHNLVADIGETHQVSHIIVHPQYDPFANDSDLAVLLLKSSSQLTPIPILHADEAELAAPGVSATVIGWGDDGTGDLPDTLREVTVPIVSNEVANRPESYDGAITGSMLAAGLASGGKDSCQGDSGGPLMVPGEGGQPILAGIVSWGDGCARPLKYGIYTRVSQFAEWIEREIRLTSEGTVGFTEARYSERGEAEVRVYDADLAGRGTTVVELQSDLQDSETLTLTEFTPGRFAGRMQLVPDGAVPGNGRLEVQGGGTIQLSYVDADNGTGQSTTVTASALVVADDHGNGAGSATVVDLPATIQGNIELSRDVDWFQFPMLAGKHYEIKTILNGSLNDSVISLFSPDGTSLLKTNDDGGQGYASLITWLAQTDGNYYVEVAGYGSNVGTYQLEITEFVPPPDDHGDNAPTATSLQLPADISGVIGHTADTDWFAFSAVAGTSYRIATELMTIGDTTLRVIDSDGRTQLAFNDDAGGGYASQIIWRASSSGAFYAEVAGYGSNRGSYRLKITEDIPEPDDHGNGPATATPVLVPSVTGGTIGAPDDQDWFAFAADAGTVYVLETTLNSLDDSELRLYDSDGLRQLAYNDDGAYGLASRILWRAPVAATYYAVVEGYGNFDLGSYTISVAADAVAPDDHGNDAAHATSVAVPSVTSGTIQPAGDVDWFAFTAEAGMVYVLETALNSLSDSELRLYDSDGRIQLDYDDDSGNGRASRIRWTAPAAATYYAVVEGYRSSDLGSYTISVATDAVPPDDHGNDAAHATSVAVPSVTPGTIQPAGDVDWFAFAAEAGAEYVLETTLESLGDSELRLYGSGGQVQLAFDDDGGPGLASRIRWTAIGTGTYYVVVQGHNSLDQGSYTLSVTGPVPDDHGNDAAHATSVAVPSVTPGTIQPAGDVDWFAFAAEAGAEYVLETTLNSLNDSELRLYDSDGQVQLAFDDDGGPGLASRIRWTAIGTATYYVVVQSHSSLNQGSYTLSVTGPARPAPDDHGNDAAHATSVAVPSVTSGTIQSAGDVDWFAFAAEAGAEYVLKTTLESLGNSELRLYDSDGQVQLAFDNDGGPGLGSRIRWTAIGTATYYVVVQSHIGVNQGAYAYTISIVLLDDHGDDFSESTPVEIGSVTPGTIGGGADSDWLGFAAQAGRAYRIESRLADLSDSYLRLFDRDGRNELMRNDDVSGSTASRILWIAPAAGTYYVEVTGAVPTAEGAYELLISVPYGDANLDGAFSSSDFVKALQRGEYEDGIANNSTWEEGDWDGDGDFTSGDFVAAFQTGTYEQPVGAARARLVTVAETVTESAPDSGGDGLPEQRQVLLPPLLQHARACDQLFASTTDWVRKGIRPERRWRI